MVLTDTDFILSIVMKPPKPRHIVVWAALYKYVMECRGFLFTKERFVAFVLWVMGRGRRHCKGGSKGKREGRNALSPHHNNNNSHVNKNRQE